MMNNNNLNSFRIFLYHKWTDYDQPESETTKKNEVKNPKGIRSRPKANLLQAVKSLFF